MRRHACGAMALLVGSILGCGAAPPPVDEPPMAAEAESAVAPPQRTAGFRESSPAVVQRAAIALADIDSRWAVRRLDAPAEPRRRPRRGAPRDVRFRGARLDNAFRMLAEVGRFDLVLDGDFGQSVSVVLRHVEPYDALVALAEAHGARVAFRDGVVTVTAR